MTRMARTYVCLAVGAGAGAAPSRRYGRWLHSIPFNVQISHLKIEILSSSFFWLLLLLLLLPRFPVGYSTSCGLLLPFAVQPDICFRPTRAANDWWRDSAILFHFVQFHCKSNIHLFLIKFVYVKHQQRQQQQQQSFVCFVLRYVVCGVCVCALGNSGIGKRDFLLFSFLIFTIISIILFPVARHWPLNKFLGCTLSVYTTFSDYRMARTVTIYMNACSVRIPSLR